jgi:pimeloyl-[acyl-carrier protein] synthase
MERETMTTVSTGSRSAPFNPLDPQLWVNSYPILKELRDQDPVYFDPSTGICAITGHEEAEHVFRDPGGDHRYVAYQRQRQGEGVENEPYCRGMSQWVLMREGEDHDRLRGTIARDFTPRRVESLRADMYEIANALIDGFADQGEVELVAAYANALPLGIISRLLDVPSSDHARIERWMRGFRHAVEYLPMTEEELAVCNEAIGGLHEYFGALVTNRRQNPGSDLLTALIAQADSGAMTEDELIVNAWGLYAAGHETSGNAICDAIHTLITHPDKCKELTEDWSQLPSAVDELMRFDGPGLATSRLFPHDIDVGGHTIPANIPVLLFMAGANRDPRKFKDPDAIDLRRENARDHLGFGHGPHRCVGQHLARASVGVAIQVLFSRLSNIRLAGEVQWNQRTVFHGPADMRITWDEVKPWKVNDTDA